MKHIICLIDYFGALGFFLNLAKSDKDNKYTFVTTSPASYRLIKKHRIDVIFVGPFSMREDTSDTCQLDFNEIMPYRLGYLSKRKVYFFSKKVSKSLRSLIKNNDKMDLFLFIWNGSSLMGEVARCFKREYPKINLGFFETPNVPGKLFVDSKGVNKSSSLFVHPELLDALTFDDQEFNSFRTNYLSLKSIPQHRFANSIKKRTKVLEYLYHLLIGPRYFSVSKPFEIFWVRLKTKLMFRLNDTSQLPAKFVLFPMQVRTDTQIVINSDVDIIGALSIILNREEGPIVVTPHPHDIGALSLLSKLPLEQRKRIHVSTQNTFYLLDNAVKVYVINSTLGLECMILEKDVTFLGHSFYSHFDNKRLGQYLCSFLIGIDRNSNENLSQKQIDSLFSKLKITNSQGYSE